MTPLFSSLKSTAKLLGLPSFPRLQRQYLLVAFYTTSALIVTLAIIKYNTIIHPFTLADNRHYVFYVFRYTILRHPLIRYLLAPVYLACGWAVHLTLCTLPRSNVPHMKKTDELKAPSQSALTHKTKAVKTQNPDEGPKTSFVIIFLLSTALSLITAPLVEPRYFIIPWVVWRLHIPPLPQSESSPNSIDTSNTWTNKIKHLMYRGHDYRLWLETLYFLAINAVTGYIFLYKGFVWPQEPGKVQRFMW